MLKINFIYVGKISKKYLKVGIENFEKRLSSFCKITLVNVRESKIDSSQALLDEEKRLLAKMKKGYNIGFALNGKEFSSKQLAKTIDKLSLTNSTLNFIIGSSHGLSSKVKQNCNLLISFSKMTLPHQLFVLVAMEQIYRSFTIINNRKYHK